MVNTGSKTKVGREVPPVVEKEPPVENQEDGPMEEDSVKRFLTDAAGLEDMPVGTNVVLDGLVSRPDLDGATGRVSGPPSGPSRARYPVTLSSTGAHGRGQVTLSINVSNLSMFGYPVEAWAPGLWRPVAGAGVGCAPVTATQMMENFQAGKWGTPPAPPDLGVCHSL